jgi:Spy/CpxP family protein refolding chaperone
MKSRTFLPHIVLAASMLCPATFQALAQAPGGGGGGGRMAPVLTQEQMTKLREANQASQTELTALNEKLAAAQKEVLKAALAKDADKDTVKAKLEAVAKIQTDIAMLRFKAVKEVAGTVTDEQKTQMSDRPGMSYNMLFGGFGGFGGMGAGGRGGRGGGGGGGGARGGGGGGGQ